MASKNGNDFILIQWNLAVADTIGSRKRCLLQGGVSYTEVNFNTNCTLVSKNSVRYREVSAIKYVCYREVLL